MAQEPLVQHKIGFTRTEIGEIRKWQNERGLNSLSAAVRALTISALGGSAE